jgi:hypothetical protein
MANVSDPVGITIDIVRDHLYWLETGNGTLFRSDLDGSKRTEILSDLFNSWYVIKHINHNSDIVYNQSGSIFYVCCRICFIEELRCS